METTRKECEDCEVRARGRLAEALVRLLLAPASQEAPQEDSALDQLVAALGDL